MFKSRFILLIFLVFTLAGSTFSQEIENKAGDIRGIVISNDDKEVVIRSIKDGRVMVIQVRKRRLNDGTIGPIRDISQFTSELKKNDIVDVKYGYAIEGEFYFIRSIENEAGDKGAFLRDNSLLTGWMVNSSDDEFILESLETGKNYTFVYRTMRNEEGRIIKRPELVEAAKKLKIGDLVIIRYRGNLGAYRNTVWEINKIDF